MTKQHFIALADTIRSDSNAGVFTLLAIEKIADFCQSQNPNFKRDRWLDYIAGRCGKNGGAIKNR